MGITFESICEKLGFNPFINPSHYNLSGHEDDSHESPYAILSLEESEYLCEYMKIHKFKTA